MGRRTTCPECDADLHACMNCRHFDESAAHQCREPHAEQILDKEASNACDLFQLGDGASRRRGPLGRGPERPGARSSATRRRAAEDPRDALDALFRKK